MPLLRQSGNDAWRGHAAARFAPQRLRGDARAFDQGFQLRPHDGRMNAARERALREAAIGAAHDVLAADDLGEPHDPLGDQFGMLDDIGGVTDHARDQDFSGRELHAFPHPPLMRVTRIGGFERVMADAHLKDEIDDVLERHVEGVRAVPAAPADVIARALFRDTAQRVVERIDRAAGPSADTRRWTSAAPCARACRAGRHRRPGRKARRRRSLCIPGAARRRARSENLLRSCSARSWRQGARSPAQRRAGTPSNDGCVAFALATPAFRF